MEVKSMDIFDILTFIGGISLFIFGMNIMGRYLEKTAGGGLKKIIGRMTSNKGTGLLTGMGTTAIIQSSSATTVMVVGFVNSKLMTLGQAISVILGANIGTTITSWLLTLTGIESNNIFLQLLKPSSFSPVLALIGVFLLFFKSEKKKNIGMILLGFATLMFGMGTMSSSVSGLKDVDWFRNLFLAFENNPILGVLVGAFVTAVIQSSSASVGILQAFTMTGQITIGATIPIILGQNIGTCVTALMSSIGTNRNAKRASLVHLLINMIGTIVVLVIYVIIKAILKPAILSNNASLVSIATIHTAFNVFTVLLILPFTRLLEKVVCKILPDKKEDNYAEIDERVFLLPPVALGQIKNKITDMAKETETALALSINGFNNNLKYDEVLKSEEKTDHYEDLLGTYLLKLASHKLQVDESRTVGFDLKIIGDLERIADHSLNIAKIHNEVVEKKVVFTEQAINEMNVCFAAVLNIWELAYKAMESEKMEDAKLIEPLEQVVDGLVKTVRHNHIVRTQKKECSTDKYFILADLLSNIERISDHCSNIGSYVIDKSLKDLNSHENIIAYRNNEDFIQLYSSYSLKYKIDKSA